MAEWRSFQEQHKSVENLPDMTGRTEVSNDLDSMKGQIQRKLDSFVIVDNVVFRTVVEPVIAVYATKDQVKMMIAERRDSANSYTTSYFSLTDYQSALDHYQACCDTNPDRPASQEVSDVRIYRPAAFTMKVDNAELFKTTTQLLENTEKLVSKMPSSIAPLWFTVRDAFAGITLQSSDAELTQLSEAILALHDGVVNNANASDELKANCSIAAPAGQRWETRPISTNRPFNG